jgi:hypothetical protein
MLASRFAFVAYFVLVFVLNGWGLLAQIGAVPPLAIPPMAIYVFNMISAPVAIWVAYRTGELAEGEFRRKNRA